MGLRSRLALRAARRTLRDTYPGLPPAGLDPGILYALAKDSDAAVRFQVVRCPDVPSEALYVLASDADQDIRDVVSHSPATQAEALYLLVVNGSSRDRFSVCEHPNVTPYLLELVATHLDPDLRIEALGHPASTLDMLAAAYERTDQVRRVREYAHRELCSRLEDQFEGRGMLLARAVTTARRSVFANEAVRVANECLDALTPPQMVAALALDSSLDPMVSFDDLVDLAFDLAAEPTPPEQAPAAPHRVRVSRPSPPGWHVT